MKDKLFIIFLGILIFTGIGIAGNLDLDVPVPRWSVIMFTISAIYCIGRIVYFDLFEEE